MADYNNQYLTLVAKGSGNFKFETTDNQSYYYSANEGGSWTSGDSATTIAVSNGDRVMFKGTLTPIYSYPSYGIGRFSASTQFEAEGNIMSLLFGDNFIGQTSLSGKKYAFYYMFYDCTNLTSIENLVLPATTLATSCYHSMFRGTSIQSIPSGLLPATTLAVDCYQFMFDNCASLTTIPTDLLPATTLVDSCYGSMFSNCSHLTTVPSDLLPTTSLAYACYDSMFFNCTALTKAPTLPATTLASYCYCQMFYDCTSLSAITCYATDISANGCTTNWVSGVASNGTFYKAASMNDWTRSTSGIPVNWNVVDYYEPIYKWERITPVQGDPTTFICDECPAPQYRWTATTGYECSGTTKIHREKKQVSYDSGETWTDVSPLETRAALPVIEYDSEDCGYVPPIDYSKEYLTFVAKGDGTITFRAAGECCYLKNEETTWLCQCVICDKTTISVNNGDRIKFKGKIYTSSCPSMIGKISFSSTTQFELEGNIMSLVYDTNFTGQTSLEGFDDVFRKAFYNCTGLTSIQNLVLPATTLASYCYSYMFAGCTSLSKLPSCLIPQSATLAEYCCEDMFHNCTSLTTLSSRLLQATALADNCYYEMFHGCRGLTSLPSGLLLATTMAASAYTFMFAYCVSLTTLPSGLLPATTLAQSCYDEMFLGCDGLTSLPSGLLPATTLADYCYQGMFRACSGLTDVSNLELPATTLAPYCYYGMFSAGFSYSPSSLTKAPVLLATTLVEGCYGRMFEYCSNLNEITCLATDISANGCTLYWVRNVASRGTFKCPSSTNWTRGTDGIPNNWTRVNI